MNKQAEIHYNVIFRNVMPTLNFDIKQVDLV